MARGYTYLNLRVSARARLKVLRDLAAAWNSTHPHAPMRSPTWRQVRFATFKGPRGLSGGSQADGTRVSYTHDGPEFRNESRAWDRDDCPRYLSREAMGYYTDLDATECAYPLIARLPHGRWIAGYEWTNNGERVYFHESHDSAADACSAAYHYAEKFAETEREYQERYRAAQECAETLAHDVHYLRRLLVNRNSRRACYEGVREEIREWLDKVRRGREAMTTEYAEFAGEF